MGLGQNHCPVQCLKIAINVVNRRAICGRVGGVSSAMAAWPLVPRRLWAAALVWASAHPTTNGGKIRKIINKKLRDGLSF